MSSAITVIADTFNDGRRYDAMLKHPALLQDTEVNPQILLKNAGTKEGNPCAMIVFPVVQKDGSLAMAQTVTTVRLLKASLVILNRLYPDL